jgi:hypothetical protein
LSTGDTIEVEVVSGGLLVTGSVVILNTPPRVAAVQFSYSSVITAHPKGEDLDGDNIGYRYQWLVNGIELSSVTGYTLSGALFTKDDRVSIAITPYDKDSDGETVRVKDVLIENKPPQIISSPPAQVEEGKFIYAIVAKNPESEPLSYFLETAPDGMTIDTTTGKVQWRPDAEVIGPQQVKIKVEDASGRWSAQEFVLDIQDTVEK